MAFRRIKMASALFLVQLLVFGCGGPDLEDFLGGEHLVLKIESKEDPNIDRENVAETMKIIEERLDKFGIRERIVAPQNDRYIIIQIAPHDLSKRAVNAISRPGVLEFKLVDEAHDAEAAVSGNVPPGLQLLYGLKRDEKTKKVRNTPFLVKQKALMARPPLEDAKPVVRYEQHTVYIELNEEDGLIFEKITADNIKKRLAVVVDDVVVSDPEITEKVPGGRIGVAGYLTKEAAHDIALKLNTGPYPVDVSVVESRTLTGEIFLGDKEE